MQTDYPTTTDLLLTWGSASAALLDNFIRTASPEQAEAIGDCVNNGGTVSIIGELCPPTVCIVLTGPDAQADPVRLGTLRLPDTVGSA